MANETQNADMNQTVAQTTEAIIAQPQQAGTPARARLKNVSIEHFKQLTGNLDVKDAEGNVIQKGFDIIRNPHQSPHPKTGEMVNKLFMVGFNDRKTYKVEYDIDAKKPMEILLDLDDQDQSSLINKRESNNLEFSI